MLHLESRFENPDAAYRLLIEAHRGLSLERSQELNASLVLLLANHIGRMDVLGQAINIAKGESNGDAPRT